MVTSHQVGSRRDFAFTSVTPEVFGEFEQKNDTICF